MWNTTVSWASAGLFSATILTGAEPESSPLRVRVYNLAHAPMEMMAPAQQQATRLLAAAGVHITWTEGLPSDPEARLLDFSPGAEQGTCSERQRPAEIKLRFIADSVDGIREALGYALPCARFGVEITLFLDRLEHVPQRFGVSTTVAIGYAMAHELGHLLLRSAEHTRRGIMRAKWTSEDWRKAAKGALGFERSQMERISAELMRTSQSP